MRRGVDPHRYPIFPNDRRPPGRSARSSGPRRAANLALLTSIAGLIAISALFFR